MKIIDLEKKKYNLPQLLDIARKERVLLLTGKEEFVISLADNFDAEIEALNNSPTFQSFLEERSSCEMTYSIKDVEKIINEDLGKIP